jgi:glycosyltransferase involved in cell wall biosynthesis
MVGDYNGCSMYRVFAPCAELQRQGAPPGAAEWIWKDHPQLGHYLLGCDAVVLSRLSWAAADRADAARWVGGLRLAGRRVWYEVDDDLFSPWITHQQLRGGTRPDKTEEQLEGERLARIFALSLCDGVTVTSQRLATVVRQYTAPEVPVAVVPNAIDWRWARAVVREGGPRDVPPVTVGWAGGARPDADTEAMAWAWGELARRRPAVRFVVQGHQPRRIYEAVPRDRITAIGWLPLESYLVGLRNVDVACCPLADKPFNRCKTTVKAQEAAAAGSAVVASPTIYRQLITPGEDGLLCETGPEWLAALERLVDDDVERRRLGRNLRRTVATEHSLEANAWRWPAAWTRLWTAAHSGGLGPAPGPAWSRVGWSSMASAVPLAASA